MFCFIYSVERTFGDDGKIGAKGMVYAVRSIVNTSDDHH